MLKITQTYYTGMCFPSSWLNQHEIDLHQPQPEVKVTTSLEELREKAKKACDGEYNLTPEEIDHHLKQSYGSIPHGTTITYDPADVVWINKMIDELSKPFSEKVKKVEEAGKNFVKHLDEEGTKHDTEKPRTDLLPVESLMEIADVLATGAKKYNARNWEKGMDYSRLYGAALRHLFAWWSKEEQDPETSHNHLAHAGCCILFLLHYTNFGKYTPFDDRPDYATEKKS